MIHLGITNIQQIIIGTFGQKLDIQDSIVSIISYAVMGIFTLLSFIIVLFDREMKFWKVVSLLACNLILDLGLVVQYKICTCFARTVFPH